MKKLVGLFVALFVCSIFTVKGWAIEWPDTAVVKTSVADFSGQGAVDFSFTLKNFNDSSTEVTEISWDIPSLSKNLGKKDKKWYSANTYADMSSNITKNNATIYMFTTNKLNSTAGYIAKSSGTCGLIYKDAATNDVKNMNIISFSTTTVKTSSAAVNSELEMTLNATYNPNLFGARYLPDFDKLTMENQTDLEKIGAKIANSKGLITAINEAGVLCDMGKTGIMYFYTNIDDVLGGEKYGTDTINLIKVIE